MQIIIDTDIKKIDYTCLNYLTHINDMGRNM